MRTYTRREVLRSGGAFAASLALLKPLGGAPPGPDVRDRIHGLLLGSFLGDALGGPIEFQDREEASRRVGVTKLWKESEVLDAEARAAATSRLRLGSYRVLRPEPEPYAHWTPSAEPGTITDDSRHKLILIDALWRAEKAGAWPFDVRALARAFLQWPAAEAIRSRPGYVRLADDWLLEWQRGARWVLGERDLSVALPPERMWTGLPTCCGQMTLLPLAALYPGRPIEAYRGSYHLAFFDNGVGKDLNAALVAGLSQALVTPSETGRREAWSAILGAMTRTDPYRYGEVPWTPRPVERWLEVAHRFATEADHHPARLFASLEKEFASTIKWEAQVPFVVAFAVIELCDHDPLAALQLSLEWGHDTDSYAALVGAFIGALHGPGIFPASLRDPVERRLELDYGETMAGLVDVLDRLRARGAEVQLVRLEASSP